MNFVTFERFIDHNEAVFLAETLILNGVEAKVEDVSTSFDPSFSFNKVNKDFRVKISPDDFPEADKILLLQAEASPEWIDPAYYLLAFSDEELKEIIYDFDQWSRFDYLLAIKILKERGQEVSTEAQVRLRNERLKVLAAPEKKTSRIITVGYLMAFLAGFIGVSIGWHIWKHKRALPDGKVVFSYTGEDRVHGKRIFWIGLVLTIVLFTFLYRFRIFEA